MDAEEVRRALAAADAAYEPFSPFAAWAQESVALGSWDDAAEHLASVRAAAPVDAVNAALDEVLRAAAVDTGAIEGLYRADRGFTRSVARNVISLDQAEVEAGLGFRRSFEAQLAGFELALQLAIGDEVITEAAIREVHRVTCADESTYRVLAEHGVQERDLVLGSYKTETNHVELADGTWHSYAPVDRVPEEVHRLVEEIRSEAFGAASAVVQAAFVHHAFTSVHPFADGNGRVARLLASIPLLRTASIPLWVEVADRPRYLDALEAADRGDRQPLLRFVTSTTLSLMRELALAIEPSDVLAPAGSGEPAGPDELAAGMAVGALQEALVEVVEGQGAFLTISHLLGPNPPPGIHVPVNARMAVSGEGITPTTFAFGVVMDADDDSRFLLLSYRTASGELVRRDVFSAGDLRPHPSPAAMRRFGLIGKLVVLG